MLIKRELIKVKEKKVFSNDLASGDRSWIPKNLLIIILKFTTSQFNI